MQRYDIRHEKNDIRESIKLFRRQLDPELKKEYDNRIIESLKRLACYSNSKTIITYVSTDIEVDTHKLIKDSLKLGKRVAVPRCISKTRDMKFYYINSFDDLEKGTFSVYEPIPEKCEELKNYSHSICIVPALSFDVLGYRLGYGKGYYDRFLSKYFGMKIGLCYNDCIKRKLPRGRFDIPVDVLITEKFTKRYNK